MKRPYIQMVAWLTNHYVHSVLTQFFDPLSTNSLLRVFWARIVCSLGLGPKIRPYNWRRLWEEFVSRQVNSKKWKDQARAKPDTQILNGRTIF